MVQDQLHPEVYLSADPSQVVAEVVSHSAEADTLLSAAAVVAVLVAVAPHTAVVAVHLLLEATVVPLLPEVILEVVPQALLADPVGEAPLLLPVTIGLSNPTCEYILS